MLAVQTKRTLLFLFGCIVTRLLMAYFAKIISPTFLPFLGYGALIISASFIYLYIFGNKKADEQLKWSGENYIWWNNLRIVHGLFYLLFAIYAIQKKPYAWVVLLLDVIFGLTAWLFHRVL